MEHRKIKEALSFGVFIASAILLGLLIFENLEAAGAAYLALNPAWLFWMFAPLWTGFLFLRLVEADKPSAKFLRIASAWLVAYALISFVDGLALVHRGALGRIAVTVTAIDLYGFLIRRLRMSIRARILWRRVKSWIKAQ